MPSNYYQPTMLQQAIESSDVEAVRFLTERGVDVNESGKGTLTPLHMAAQHGNAEIVRLLLRCGADVDAECAFEDGMTPLREAVKWGHLDVCKLLIQYGADPLQVDMEGNTLAHTAVLGDNPELLEYLASQGVDLEQKNIDFLTPAELAQSL